ncbi:MAG: sigma-70 family RNA polymerase sigma factor [Planctomycetota bacterium]|nr:MAG: sigma-70 family RNA polymerase sigma factor [Planctomycetota bacterium]KAB2942431.1 MAG: sigma-70 family RNA polymerase sigma factor [Phycisphaerae bacterium]MCQ3920862.1 hypothetical protein [Planctomycetota bacterium]
MIFWRSPEPRSGTLHVSDTLITDETLLKRVAARDSEAFSRLYDRCAGRVYAFILRLIGPSGDAEDVLQETFCQVWAQADRYSPDRSAPLAWMLLIARSRSLDHLRRRRVRASVPEIETPPVSDDVAEIHELNESRRSAGEALRRLPSEQSRLITLAFYGGLTHEQIARRESLPLGTVKTRIRRGMLSLKETLNAEVAKPCT